MRGLNQIIAAGNVASKPVIRTFTGKDGKPFKKASIFLICNDQVPKKQADGSVVWEEVARPVNIEATNHQAEYVEKYVDKGSAIIVTGRYELNAWEETVEKVNPEGGEVTTEKVKRQNPYIHAEDIISAGGGTALDEAGKVQIAHDLLKGWITAPGSQWAGKRIEAVVATLATEFVRLKTAQAEKQLA